MLWARFASFLHSDASFWEKNFEELQLKTSFGLQKKHLELLPVVPETLPESPRMEIVPISGRIRTPHVL